MTEDQIADICAIAKRVANKHKFRGALSGADDLYGAALEGGLRFGNKWDGREGGNFGVWVAWGCKCGINDYYRKINHGRGSLGNFQHTYSVIFTDAPTSGKTSHDEMDWRKGASRPGNREHRYAPSVNGEYTTWIGFWERVEALVDKREWEILWLVYHQGWTQTDVAKKFGLTDARISQIRRGCLDRLSAQLDMGDYL